MYPTIKQMHGVRKSTLLLAVVLMFNCCAAWAARPVVIGFDTSAPPFFNVRDGKPEGIYPAIVEAVFKDAGIPMVMTGAPFTAVLANVDSGRWAAGGILKTPERVRKYDYTDYIFVESVYAYYSKVRPLHLSRLSDLAGKRIGILRGWSYGEAFDAAVKELGIKVEVDWSAEASFRKLQLGQIDAVLALEEVGTNLMASAKYPNVVKADMYVRQNPSYIAFRKGSGHKATIRRLNRSILRMRTSGQLWTLVVKQIDASYPGNRKAQEGAAGEGGRHNRAP